MGSGIVAALLDLVVPAACVGCGSAGADLCGPCAVPLRAPPRWAVPTPCPAGLPPVAAIALYDGAVRQAVVSYKERAAFALAAPLSAALARAVAFALLADPPAATEAPVLVPLPSSTAARRARGDEPLRRLVHRAAASLARAGIPVEIADRTLHHVRAVRDSAGLSASARAANLAGALAVDTAAARRLAGRRTLLVDDLMTTGATLVEAARALRAAGVEPVAGAVVATAIRRHPR